MNYPNSFTLKLARVGIAGTLALILATSPLANMGVIAAEAVPSLVSTKMHNTQKDSLEHAPIQYQIQARLNEKDMTIQGSEKVTYRNTSKDTLQQLVLHTYADANLSKSTQANMFQQNNEKISEDHPEKTAEDFLGGIDIQAVTADSQSLDFHKENQALTVQLKEPVKPGESVVFQLEFHLNIPYGSQRVSYYKDIINGAHWFPVMSVYDEVKHQWNKAPYSRTFESDYYTSSDFEVQLNVPDDYQVAMPGAITTQDSSEHGRKIVSAVAENTREFVFFASPNLQVERATRNGLTVEYYYYNDDPSKKKIVDRYINQAFKVIDFYSEKYGKYPYPEFRIVETYVQGVAVEYARLIQMGQIHDSAVPEEDTTFVHEIAHQWFHALIGNNSETESFLDEGFADFSMVYFAEKQGDKLNGFRSIQFDTAPVDMAIASTNDEAGDLAGLVYYQKGRQAIYQLYRSVGEEKFDELMRTYFKRYVYQNATIEGLLQTIEDVLGKEVRTEMQTALYQPDFVLKPEFQLSQEETAAYVHDILQAQYQAVMGMIPDLPYEVMNRLMDKVLQGEELTIVLSDQASKLATKQQEDMVNQLTGFLDMTGMRYDIIRDRKELKQKMKKEIGNSNLIVIGNAKSNGLVQALKFNIIDRTKLTGFSWKNTMNQPLAAGAYVIKHPYNQNRLMLHYFWNEDHLSDAAFEAFKLKIQESIGFTNDFYQYYVLDNQGKEKSDKKVANPISSLFAE
ncbi:M1 family metallopeptidase [Paenibacillus sp. 1781tsa1]|uniref:M1 family metallopeptidase n=1 Tax=Paenibacillus sp. 1781tsa1 TaxID=2953810 RepID=UPI0020A14657|nr:M1 family metallopeptidase [Paenibacillus sp. 1781tsa1]MCP1185649.1 M1 family metallopeptidase [Paenibacillus sp. 1781tsa1]